MEFTWLDRIMIGFIAFMIIREFWKAYNDDEEHSDYHDNYF
jgi:hypothetical protein